MSERKEKKEKRKKRKHTALIMCHHAKPFWTTQAQFWQWAREHIIVKIHDQPLTGVFVDENEELMVVLSNTVLNLANQNHLHEALSARRMKKSKG
ncbi:MAG TPA: hypothetical protein VJT15_13530 [Pyrinomonadaceae bacterium]|nr:hypothetical protein [Pyrinomonadaceae bacterium]